MAENRKPLSRKEEQEQIEAVWRDMERGLISPVVAETRINRVMALAGWRSAGSISYRAD